MSSRLRLGAAVVAAVLLPIAAVAGPWHVYRSKEYGFSMLVPHGAEFQEKEHGAGWATLVASKRPITLYGVARLGDPAEASEIEALGVKLTGVASEHWKVIDQGADESGWKWYVTVRATDGEKVVFGGYGVGPRGSYILLLETTVADFEAHRSDYQTWYESIELH